MDDEVVVQVLKPFENLENDALDLREAKEGVRKRAFPLEVAHTANFLATENWQLIVAIRCLRT